MVRGILACTRSWTYVTKRVLRHHGPNGEGSVSSEHLGDAQGLPGPDRTLNRTDGTLCRLYGGFCRFYRVWGVPGRPPSAQNPQNPRRSARGGVEPFSLHMSRMPQISSHSKIPRTIYFLLTNILDLCTHLSLGARYMDSARFSQIPKNH